MHEADLINLSRGQIVSPAEVHSFSWVSNRGFKSQVSADTPVESLNAKTKRVPNTKVKRPLHHQTQKDRYLLSPSYDIPFSNDIYRTDHSVQ